MSSAQSPVAEPVVLVVMGVSGSGKSRVAGLLAGRLGWDLAEGDELHPPENIAKMASGHPLTDADRWPWLAKVAAWIKQRTDVGQSGVITCSALKRSYRDLLRGEHVVFVYLAGDRDVIATRLGLRHGHFMPSTLLDSQFATLEPPGPDERSVTVDISASVADEADEIVARLGLRPDGATA
ncbi:MAG TPA: gluconokinase [Jatrophihabitantaceae bacterium]